MGFDELVQHDASELTNGTLPAGRLPADGKFVNSLKVATGGLRPLEISEYIDGGGGDGIQYKTEGSQHFIIDENDSNTNRSFSVRTDGTNFTNSDPLLLVTDEPEVGIGFGDPINSLGISGGAVVGSGYAGSNTAPTDGALFEGGVGFGTTSVSGAATFGGDVFVEDNLGVVIGNTSFESGVGFAGSPEFQVIGIDQQSRSALIASYDDRSSADAILQFLRSNSNTVGATGTALSSGDRLGSIIYAVDDGNDNNSISARIRAAADAAHSQDDTPGRLEFVTTPHNSDRGQEALRIDSSQDVMATRSLGVGLSASETPSARLHVASSNNPEILVDDRDGGGFPGLLFGANGTLVSGVVQDNFNDRLEVRAGGADLIHLEESGALKLQPESAGGVGIGVTATNTLGVSGGAVIGSGFAGSNTAPTDGLLVEGKIEISSNGAGIFLNNSGDVVAVDDSGNTSVLT